MLSVIVAVETEFLVELLINQIVFTVSFPSISMRVCVLLTLQVPIRISTGLNPDYRELTKLPGLIITSHLSQHPLINNNFKGADKKKSKKKRNRLHVYIEEGHRVNKEVNWVCTHIGHLKCPGHVKIQNRT